MQYLMTKTYVETRGGEAPVFRSEQEVVDESYFRSYAGAETRRFMESLYGEWLVTTDRDQHRTLVVSINSTCTRIVTATFDRLATTSEEGWLAREAERARERAESVPPHARPTINRSRPTAPKEDQ